MLSVTFSEFGNSEVLRISELPKPTAGRGEVVVRVAASTINPTDIMMRSGAQARLMEHIVPPYIAGMEFSGHVHEAGEGVSLQPGDAVIGVVNPRRQEGGAHAQYVRVPAISVAAIADDENVIAATTVPMNALTAWLAFELIGQHPSKTVLVTGGTGMLGGFAIQLGRHFGMTVIANGAKKDASYLEELGASVVVPRDTGMIEAIKTRYPEGVDALIDGALIGTGISPIVRDGGTAVSLRMSHPINDPRLKTPYVSVINGMDRGDIMREIAQLLGRGILKPHLAEGGRFPFREAVKAFSATEAGRFRGRYVLDFTVE